VYCTDTDIIGCWQTRGFSYDYLGSEFLLNVCKLSEWFRLLIVKKAPARHRSTVIKQDTSQKDNKRDWWWWWWCFSWAVHSVCG